MIPKETLQEVLSSQEGNLRPFEKEIPREILHHIDTDLPFVMIITGIRRCGKSTLLRQILEKTKDKPAFINFEDLRLDGFTLNDFTRLDSIFQDQNKTVFFFDEIQNVAGWEKYVRTRHDAQSKVFITGSNASILKGELGSKLTGRHLTIELFPFSYKEYLDFLLVSAGPESLLQYMESGGFPSYLSTRREEVLVRIFEDILYRDIIARYGIRNHAELRQIAVYLLTNSAKLFTFNSLRKIFSLGAANTVSDYISHFEDSYLMFSVPKFSFSHKQQMRNPRKVYSIDTGLSTQVSLSFSKDLGRKLENLVFLHLRKKYKNIYYYSESHECDFIISEKNKVAGAVQACIELTPDNIDREINGITEAMIQLKITQGMIITLDQEDRFEKNGKHIEVIPAWKWMTKFSSIFQY